MDLLEHLLSFVSDQRRELFLDRVNERTKKITVVLEDIYQSHNSAAVLRSCDCFGIQDVHIIENRNEWNPHPDIEQGSSKWLSLQRYQDEEENTTSCFRNLSKSGYVIASTTPHTELSIEDIPTDKPIALVFGTEKEGISEIAKAQSDLLVRIPMFGFTESFNISVAAAISMHSVRSKFLREGRDLKLTEDERRDVLIEWCKRTISRGEMIAAEFEKRKDE